MLYSSRRTSVVRGVCRNRFLAVHCPQIAGSYHLYVMAALQLRSDLIEIAPAASDSDMPKADAIIRADDSVIRQSGTGQHSAARQNCSRLTEERTTVQLRVIAHHCSIKN